MVRTACCATMEVRKTGHPNMKNSHLNDRGYSVRSTHLQLTVQWLILAAWVVGIDAAATNWTIRARKPIVTRLITVNGADYYLHEG